ncbi:MAG: HAD family hydrolase [Ignavibacteria bacterium]|nr:HAD family hydrolase [Ignavibacteria bacterium]
MNKEGKYKVVIFDLGETLIEYVNVPLSWKNLYPEIFNRINEYNMLGLSEHQIEKICCNLEKYNTRINPREKEFSAEYIFFNILEEFRIYDDIITQKIIPQFFNFFQQKRKTYPETEEVLKTLKENGLKTAIFTDVPYGMPDEFVFEDIKSFASYIDKVVTSVSAGFRKPNPAGLEMICDHFPADKNEIIYVGNEEKDIIVCKNIGCKSVLINREETPKNFGEDYQFKTLTELTNLIIKSFI